MEYTTTEYILIAVKFIIGLIVTIMFLCGLVISLFRKPPNNDAGGGYIGYSHIHEPEKWDRDH